MDKRKLTIGMVVGALAAAALAVALFKRDEPVAAPAPAVAEQEAQPADSTPARIEEAPRRTQDVFMPPPTDATGSSTVKE